MRLVSLRKDILKIYSVDPEMLQKSYRPCVLIVKLKYKGHKYDFAVPLRSNLNPSTPKDQFFPLPTRKSTKAGHRHGIHYVKMFPIKKSFVVKYRTDGNAFATLVKETIDKNEKAIIADCQRYLSEYESGNRPMFCTDIDLLIKTIEEYEK